MAESKVTETTTAKRDKSPAYVKPAKGKKFTSLAQCEIWASWGEDAYLNIESRRYPPAQSFDDYATYVDAVEEFSVALSGWVQEAREAMPSDKAKRSDWVAAKRKEVRDAAAVSRVVESGALGELFAADPSQASKLIAGMDEGQRAAMLAALTGASSSSEE